MKEITLLALLLLTSCTPSASRNLPGTSARDVTPSCEASAHRGLREEAPDNSLPAITRALEEGISFVELDVRWGADGALFLFHEKRMLPPYVVSPEGVFGKRPEELTTEERKSVCLSRGRPCTPLASLSDALDLLRGLPAFYQLDLKGDSLRALPLIAKLADEAEVSEKLIIQTSSLEEYFTVRRSYPKFKTLYRVKNRAQFEEALKLQPDIIQGDLEWVSTDLVDAAHSQGIRVLVKALTPDSENVGVYQTIFRKGVDIILSDKPVQVLRMARMIPECGDL